MNKRL
jgi:hypothetical protein